MLNCKKFSTGELTLMFSTPLSGNALFCLAQKGYQAAELRFGSSVYTEAYLETLGSRHKYPVGQELKEASRVAAEAWQKAFDGLLEQPQAPGSSLIQVSFFTEYHQGFQEFVAKAAAIQALDQQALSFSSAVSGQELYALLDAGYQPRSFVFANIVYATGLRQTLPNSFKAFARGEIPEFSANLNQSRQKALQALKAKAAAAGAQTIVGIRTTILPFSKSCEILLLGTACDHALLSPSESIGTSSLSPIETWNLAKLGYQPLALVMKSAVYSMGLKGAASSFKAFFRGENKEVAVLMKEVREKLLAGLEEEAAKLGADQVVAVKTQVYALGNGLLDCFAEGTAVKKGVELKTASSELLAQALALDEASFYNAVGNITKGSPFSALNRLAVIVLIILGLVWLKMHN